MKTLEYPERMAVQIALTSLIVLSGSVFAQVPVDDDGNVIGHYESTADVMPIGNEDIPRLSSTELQDLVGPIALYPDDLLAIVLPASAYPLQIVDVARFLEALKTDPSLQPNPEWDDSVVALTNYPEVVELLNADIDWTWRLGEAVVAHQDDVIAAVETFRDRAYAAGNLESDAYQTVSRSEGTIEITPISEDVIYVPYYEPAQVVVYQPRPVYYYHPRAYPVYYYPYAAGHYFDRGFFWGVTTAFSIGWHSDSLHVHHHSYHGHPYHGRSYGRNWWYRRASINVYNTTYASNTNMTVNRYSNGDRWRARENRHEYVVREGYSRHVDQTAITRSTSDRRASSRNDGSGQRRSVHTRQLEPITFRERPTQIVAPVRNNLRQPRETHREEPVTRTARQNTVRREPVVRERELQQRERNPARDVHVRNEPRRTEPTRTEPTRTEPTRTEPTRTERAPAERESRSNERAERSERPERREKISSSRSRERRR